MTFIISPFPAPSSSKLNFFGEPILFQKVIVQIAIISENSLVILGAVIKSVDAYSLAEGIKGVLKEGIKKDILSNRCQKFASQFDWSVCGKKYFKL